MQSARVLYDPHQHAHAHAHHGSMFTQPPPLSFDDPYLAPSSSSTNLAHHHSQSSNQASHSHSLGFDLQLPLFPPPPASFESMNFFSSNEQDDMLDFLRDFDTADPWEFNPILPSSMPPYPLSTSADNLNNPLGSLGMQDAMPVTAGPELDQSGVPHDSSSVASVHSSTSTILPDSQTTPQAHRQTPSPTGIHPYRPHSSHRQSQTSSSNGHSISPTDYRAKGGALLSGPQKRMNHVKSEKRRRDTIRDGYLTLTKLLSPSGPGAEQLAIPRRGRPKGSGRAGGGKKTGKGKSGVLFRAVEYIRFMEEGCAGLEKECERLERLVLSTAAAATGSTSAAHGQMQYGHSW